MANWVSENMISENMISDNVVSFEDERNRRVRRKKHAGSFAWLGCVMICLVALVVGFGFAQSPVFNVRTINVSGISHISKDDVVALSGITLGEHIGEANVARAKSLISTNLWVEQVSVERKFPSTINIVIKERVPTAAITTADGIYIVDSSGMLLMKQKLFEGLSVVVVSGIDDVGEDVRLGTVLEGDKLSAALSVIRQMDESSASVIAELNVSNSQKIIAHTTYGVDFYLGSKSDFADKFKLASQILENESGKGRMDSLDYIDVSLVEQPVLAYLT
jgi:cell division septal protein FtsQ